MLSSYDLFYLVELLSVREERDLLTALVENPLDRTKRLELVNYLVKMGRSVSAELIRGGYTPGRNQPVPQSALSGADEWVMSGGEVRKPRVGFGGIR